MFDVSLCVPPPYWPPGVPGLVTVTETLPGVPRFVAGIAAVTWFPFTYVVGWTAPFHFTIALAAKPLPLTVKVNAGSPAFALSGTSAATAGTTPGCAGVVVLLEYPHPAHRIAIRKTQMIFIRVPSDRLVADVVWHGPRGRVSRRCQGGVIFWQMKCKGADRVGTQRRMVSFTGHGAPEGAPSTPGP